MDIIEIPLDIFPEIEISIEEDLIIRLEKIKDNKLKLTSNPFNDKKAYNNIKKVINEMEETFKDIRHLLYTLECYVDDHKLYEKIKDLLNLMDKIELEIKNKIRSDRLLKSDSLLLESIIYIERLNYSLNEIIDWY